MHSNYCYVKCSLHSTYLVTDKVNKGNSVAVNQTIFFKKPLVAKVHVRRHFKITASGCHMTVTCSKSSFHLQLECDSDDKKQNKKYLK